MSARSARCASPAATLVALSLMAGAASPLVAGTPRTESPPRPAPLSLEIVFLDGGRVEGDVLSLEDRSFRLAGREEPIPFWEVREARFLPVKDGPEIQFDLGPLVRFREKESLVGRVLQVRGERAKVRIDRVGDVSLPLESMLAFRLREAYLSDDRFEKDLGARPPARDTVYVRRRNLLRIEGIFRRLDSEYLWLEYGGRVRKLRRSLVQGVILAPVASSHREPDPPEVLEIEGRGRLPAHIVALSTRSAEAPRLRVRFPGAPAAENETIALARIGRIHFASDRTRFLSDLKPSKAVRAPVLGKGFPWRRDRSSSGDPIRLGGRTYRRGLGVSSASTLEYEIGGKYRSFAAVIGLDDGAGPAGSVTFAVELDGKEVYRRAFEKGDAPVPVALPLNGVDVLRLRVDYGKDGLDIGDHAVWADARLTVR